MIAPDLLIDVGVFGKPVGYKGGILLLTDRDADISDDVFVFVMEDGLPVPWHIAEARRKGDGYLVRIKDVDTLEDVARFTGSRVFVTADMLSEPTDDGEILYEDLVGYTISDGNDILGVIVDVDDSTSNVIFDVERPGGERFLVPAADDFIEQIDQIKKEIVMILPDGLLDLN